MPVVFPLARLVGLEFPESMFSAKGDIPTALHSFKSRRVSAIRLTIQHNFLKLTLEILAFAYSSDLQGVTQIFEVIDAD